jgi:hypothetical protein
VTMAEGWTPGGEEGGTRLPRVEDLPVVQEGYDPGAVAAAFDAFYRHAAQLDATLAVLESVATFRKEAGDLRADIRELRASAWGPLPGRQTWAAGYAVRASSQRGGFLDVAPRIAVEAAFIILVAVGAAIADLSTTTVVLVVVAAWLVVGLAEVLASLTREPAPPPMLRPSPLPPEPEPVRAAAPEPASEPALEPVRDPWEVEALPVSEPEPEPVAEEPEPEEPEPEPEEPEAEEPEAEEPEAEEPEPVVEEPVVEEPEPELEPEPVAEVAAAEEPPEQRRRFWRRRDEAEADDEPQPVLTDALQRAVTPARVEDSTEDTGPLPVAEEPEPDGRRPVAGPVQRAASGRTRRRGR